MLYYVFCRIKTNNNLEIIKMIGYYILWFALFNYTFNKLSYWLYLYSTLTCTSPIWWSKRKLKYPFKFAMNISFAFYQSVTFVKSFEMHGTAAQHVRPKNQIIRVKFVSSTLSLFMISIKEFWQMRTILSSISLNCCLQISIKIIL